MDFGRLGQRLRGVDASVLRLISRLIFFIFPFLAGEKKVYRNNSYILYFSKKKKKNKKIVFFILDLFAATVEVLYLCRVVSFYWSKLFVFFS